MTELINHWIFLGLALPLLYLPPLWREGSTASRLLACALLMLALVQLHSLLTVSTARQAFVTGLHMPALYAIAPLFFLYIESLLGEQVLTNRVLRHLWPTLMISLMALLTSTWHRLELATLQQGIYVASFAIGSIYVLAVLRRLGRLAHPASLARVEALLLVVVTITGLAAALVALLGALLDRPLFYQLYGSAITALLVCGHFLYQRYPELSQLVSDELQEAAEARGDNLKPRRSHLNGIDTDARLARLQRLMQEQQLYRQEDLSLETLATACDLSSHQLSELLNAHLGLNFSRYLKQHRIADARELLLNRPALSVLDVGLSVGFSSLSAFYAAFRDIEGMAPGMYRKQQRAKC